MQYPHWRLSGFYWLYYAILGGMIPYWGRYFQLQGFDAQQIGWLMAVVSLARLLGPNAWAYIADRTNKRLFYFRLAVCIGAVCFGWITLVDRLPLLLLSIFCFAFCWGAVMPQFEAIAMAHLSGQRHKYTLVRLWGSVGYVVLSLAMGSLLDYFMQSGFVFTLFLLFLATVGLAFAIPKQPQDNQQSPNKLNVLHVLRQPQVVVFFCALLLLNLSHSPFYTYFDIYITSNGYSGTTSGILIAVGVIAEIGIFVIVPRLLSRHGVKRLLLLSFALATIRWILTANFIDNLAIMFAAQLTHAATFGIAHAASIQWVSRVFTDNLQSRGQAFFTSFTYGAGGMLGNLLFGSIWQTANGSWLTFMLGSAACALGFILILLFIPSLRSQQYAD